MLARCCLMTEAESCPSSNLTRSLMEQCASECVAAAQSTVFAVHQSQSHNFSMLPAWWYRVSYMYTAAMVLAVSTLRPDLFPRSTTQNAWDNVLVLFQTHEHLSDSVQVCRVALQRIFSRIEQMQGVSSSTFVFEGNTSDQQDTTVGKHPNYLQDFTSYLDDLALYNFDSMSWFTDEQAIH